MSSVTTAPSPGTEAEAVASVERLRCPGERKALTFCIVANLVVLAFAFGVILAGTAWLGSHPVLERHVDWIRAVAIAGIVALPAAGIGRHAHLHAARGNGIRISEEQFPALHAELLRSCRMLGLEPVPEVYFSEEIEGPAAAYSVWDGTSVVVLNGELVTHDWEEGIDWLAFVMTGALGSIRLGHTRAWVELFTAYARSIPGLRVPLLMKWTYSRDRCAAFVNPAGIRGLLVEAAGPHVVRNVDVGAFLRQPEHVGGFWNLVAAFRRKGPSLAERAHALRVDGFFELPR